MASGLAAVLTGKAEESFAFITPDQRAFWRLLSKLDLDTLASLEPGERMAFSNLPGVRQKPLPSDVLLEVAEWRSEHNLLASALLPRLQNEKLVGRRTDLGEPEREMESQPTRVVIGVQCSARSGELIASMVGFDDSGKAIATAGGSVRVADPLKVSENPVPKPDGLIAMSPLSKDLVNARARGGMTPALRTALLDPEGHDPLSFDVSDVLLSLADQAGKNLIANPDDRMFSRFQPPEGQSELRISWARQILGWSGPRTGMQTQEDDEWLVVSPLDPLRTQSLRLSRHDLGEYLRKEQQQGYVAIADTARLAATLPGRTEPDLINAVSAFVLGHFPPIFADTFWTLRLYDALSLDGADLRPTRCADLTPMQLEALEGFVYATEDYATNSRGPEDPEPTIAEIVASGEPTERYPRGIPDDATLAVTTKNEDVYFLGPDSFPLKFDELASAIALSQAGLRAPLGDARVFEGRRTTVRLTFTVGRDVRNGYLTENAPGRESWPVDQPPEGLKKRLEAKVAELRARYKGSPAATPVKPP